MPVTTRSQSKSAATANVSLLVTEKAQQQCLPLMSNLSNVNNTINKETSSLDELTNWFKETLLRGFAKIEFYRNRTEEAKQLFRESKTLLEQDYYCRYVNEYVFENIRQVTEMMYIVNEYFPNVYRKMPSWDRLTSIIDYKTKELLNQLDFVNSTTTDEINTVKICKQTLEETKKMIVNYMPSPKRKGSIVNYTGMDMAEFNPDLSEELLPEHRWIIPSNSDYYDSDYDPAEDEDDTDDEVSLFEETKMMLWETMANINEEEEEEEEDEQDYSESEDYEYESDEDDWY